MLKEGTFATCYFVLAYTVARYVVVDGDFLLLFVFCLLLFFFNYLVVDVFRGRDIERDAHTDWWLVVVGDGWFGEGW